MKNKIAELMKGTWKVDTQARPMKLNLDKAKSFFESIRLDKKPDQSPPSAFQLSPVPKDSFVKVRKISLTKVQSTGRTSLDPSEVPKTPQKSKNALS